MTNFMSLDWKLDRSAPKRLEMNVRDALNIVVKYKTHQTAIQHIQKDFLTLQVKILSIKSLELTWFVKTAKVQMVRINLILNQIIWWFFSHYFRPYQNCVHFFIMARIFSLCIQLIWMNIEHHCKQTGLLAKNVPKITVKPQNFCNLQIFNKKIC